MAFSYLKGMRVKLWQGVPQLKAGGAPGTILSVSKEGVLIACGEGSILVTALQLPIGKGSVLTGQDILNAREDIIHQGLILRAPVEHP